MIRYGIGFGIGDCDRSIGERLEGRLVVGEYIMLLIYINTVFDVIL